MTKDEALRLALEALENYKGFIDDAHIIEGQWHWIDGGDKAITAIKQALEQEKALQALHDENERLGLYKDVYGQPEQEPVAWKDRTYGNLHHQDFGNSTPLYTSPPKREPLEGVIDVQPIGHHSLQLIFRSQADIAKFKAAHGIKGDAP